MSSKRSSRPKAGQRCAAAQPAHKRAAARAPAPHSLPSGVASAGAGCSQQLLCADVCAESSARAFRAAGARSSTARNCLRVVQQGVAIPLLAAEQRPVVAQRPRAANTAAARHGCPQAPVSRRTVVCPLHGRIPPLAVAVTRCQPTRRRPLRARAGVHPGRRGGGARGAAPAGLHRGHRGRRHAAARARAPARRAGGRAGRAHAGRARAAARGRGRVAADHRRRAVNEGARLSGGTRWCQCQALLIVGCLSACMAESFGGIISLLRSCRVC